MITTTENSMKFILEPHYDTYGNLYFTAIHDRIGYDRVNSDNQQSCDDCINAVKFGINFTVHI